MTLLSKKLPLHMNVSILPAPNLPGFLLPTSSSPLMDTHMVQSFIFCLLLMSRESAVWKNGGQFYVHNWGALGAPEVGYPGVLSPACLVYRWGR